MRFKIIDAGSGMKILKGKTISSGISSRKNRFYKYANFFNVEELTDSIIFVHVVF
jgi:hypothetical protein